MQRGMESVGWMGRSDHAVTPGRHVGEGEIAGSVGDGGDRGAAGQGDGSARYAVSAKVGDPARDAHVQAAGSLDRGYVGIADAILIGSEADAGVDLDAHGDDGAARRSPGGSVRRRI